MASRIEDYALIGDCRTAALVDKGGSIDWLCLPRFDSGACFAALLGGPDNGCWSIASVQAARSTRHYREGSLILETQFASDQGEVSVLDFMPMQAGSNEARSRLVRLVQGRRGTVAMHMDLRLRFDYGSSVPWVTRLDGGHGLRAVSGPDMVVLQTTAPLRNRDLQTRADFSVSAGEIVPFVLSHSPSNQQIPQPLDPLAALQDTALWWKSWSGRCDVAGHWEEAVRRSLVTLKALTFAPTGGIVAAPTTSLPEQWGGTRNWDYRYCWLRDATLTLLALMNAGYYEEADAWRAWLLRATAGSPSQARIMYGLAGERLLFENQLPWLAGYEGAAPVRVGNDAAGQMQLDVYGEVIDAMYQCRRGGLVQDDNAWALQRTLVQHLEGIWQEPDHGIWEFRGPKRHFTYSKLMAWVALDRAVKSCEQFGLEGPLVHWRALRSRIHEDVCRSGYSEHRGSFVQSYGGDALDASLLLMPIAGFLPPDDARVRGTVAAIQRELTVDGFVRRYSTEQSRDGLPAGEGVFLACSFWLADNLVLQGEHAQAVELFERLLALRNDVGLLAEEYDPVLRRQMGNFPQAFSHVGLINTALNLDRESAPAKQRGNGGERRPGPQGRHASDPQPVTRKQTP